MNYIRKTTAYLLSYLPTPLPIGMTEFHEWAKSIVSLLPSGFDNVTYDEKEWVLATAIIHLDATKSKVPKQYFIRLLHKGASSQVAGQIFQDIKNKQLEAKKAAELEATPPEASNVEKTQV